MKYLKLAAVLAVVVALCVPALAETQTVKVSGSLDTYWLWKNNMDLRDNNEQAVVGLGVGVNANPTKAPAATNYKDDSASWWMSVVQVEVAADLTDNVSVVTNLYNQRDWNALKIDAATAGASDRANEYTVGVDLAYLKMKEAFYAPLSLTIGRQDLYFGRGFILAEQRQDPQGMIIAKDLTAVKSFDALRATLDFKPWTIDLVVINPANGGFGSGNLGQGAANANDDRYFWFNNINYQFSQYNAEWEGYWGVDQDRAVLEGVPLQDQSIAAADGTVSARDIQTWLVGTRAQFDPVENLTVGGEVAYQWGDQWRSLTVSQTRYQRNAWALDVFGEYKWKQHAYTPKVGIEYSFLSGGKAGDTYDGWNPLFRSRNAGDIYENLESVYQTALMGDGNNGLGCASSNTQFLKLSGGLNPMEDLSLDSQVYWFWVDQAVKNTFNGELLPKDAGVEWDMHANYDYTEDVTFGLGLGMFFPGDLYGKAAQEASSVTPHTQAFGSYSKTASQVTTSVKVQF